MTLTLRLISLSCLLCVAGCGGGDSGGMKTNNESTGVSAAPAAGSGASKHSCGTSDCMPSVFAAALDIDTGESCCVDASKSLCGVKDSTGECKAPQHDSRCPDFMSALGLFSGCCTDDNMCGLDTTGTAGFGCLPLSEPALRMNEPDAPKPKACDAP
jgi:hypothetical protein